ncbi:MAG: SURF1 family protein [Pseudomonadota bacterium]
MNRVMFPILFGLLGVGVLTGLGVWQLQRLAWKENLLAEIETRISDAPIALPATPSVDESAFLSVTLTGTIDGAPIPVFGTWREAGAGYRIIAPVATEGRRVMVDLGVAGARDPELPSGTLTLDGNLTWPDEVEPNPDADIWTNLDLPAMAARLGTEPVLVVAREITGVQLPFAPIPIGTEGIPNNHFGYAVQWFGLALVWAGMTAFLLRRMHGQTGNTEA